MREIIAFCGIACHECPAFKATQANDDKKRAEVADLWSKQYSANLKPEDINCDGCHAYNGRVFNYCSTCEIRKCGMKMKVSNCAYCDSYTCETLGKFLDMVPEAKERLEVIHRKI